MPYSRKEDLMIKISKDTELTPQILKKLIDSHKQTIVPRLKKLEDYYLAKNEILKRQMKDISKPNNKVASPYASYISDTLTGYFMGQPITYSSSTMSVDELNMIMEYNDEDDENIQLALAASIFGVAYELLYIDESGDIRFTHIDTKECFPIYDNTVAEELLYVVRYYLEEDIATDKKNMWIEVISSTDVKTYKANETGGNMTLYGEKPHYFDMVPVAVYKNNSYETGDFEEVIPLIDGYDKLESDSLNNFEYFCDAYLVLVGMNADAEDIQQMKENRVLLLDEGCSAEWLLKDEQDTTIENMKNRLDKDIHKFSRCPNLSDENFIGNASGVAIKYKLIGTEDLMGVKERKFRRGLQRRLELISNVQVKKLGSFDWRAIDITFTRNIPANELEIAQMVSTLSNVVSTETLLAQIPFVEDVEAEVKRLEKEKESNPFYDMRLDYNGEEATQEDSKEEEFV